MKGIGPRPLARLATCPTRLPASGRSGGASGRKSPRPYAGACRNVGTGSPGKTLQRSVTDAKGTTCRSPTVWFPAC